MMFVATSETQGQLRDDFCHAEEGEPIAFPMLECDGEAVNGKCGCRRSMVGLRTLKATTTFKVAEGTLSFEDYLEIAASWGITGDSDEEVLDGLAKDHEFLCELAGKNPVGMVFQRRGEEFMARLR
jgi:hypothetical protein